MEGVYTNYGLLVNGDFSPTVLLASLDYFEKVRSGDNLVTCGHKGVAANFDLLTAIAIAGPRERTVFFSSRVPVFGSTLKVTTSFESWSAA